MSRPVDWHPLRASDPVPGDADAIRLLGRRWSDTARAVETAVGGLRAVHGSTTEWRSASGRTFAAQAGALAGRLDRAWWRYAAGAEVLHEYARAVDDAQEQAGAALRRGQRAHDDLVAAERVLRAATTSATLLAAATSTAVLPDAVAVRAQSRAAEARARLAFAERHLQGAERLWREASARTCSELDALAADGLTDRLDGVLDVVETATAAVTWLSAGLGLAGTAVTPVFPPVGVALGTAGLATGEVAMAGTGALWLSNRASGRDVAWAAVGPMAGGAAKALRLLDDLPRPGPGGRPQPHPAGAPQAHPTGARPPAPTARAADGSAGRATGAGPRPVPPPPARAPAAVAARPRRSVRIAETVSTGSDVRTASGAVPATAAGEQPRR